MPTGLLSAKQLEASSDLPLLLFEITSVFTGAVLRLSTHGNTSAPVTFNSNNYTGHILSSQFGGSTLFSDNGIDQPEQITLTLGDILGTYRQWDNTNMFHFADVTVILVTWNPTENVTSTDSHVIFKGLADAPSSVNPNSLTFSIFNKLILQQIPIPSLRISRFSPTLWPAHPGVADADIGAAWDKSESDTADPAWAVGYGPLRGVSTFPGSNPLGNLRIGTVASPITATIFSSTTIGAASPTMTVDSQKDHIVAITGGTGAGQAKRIISNTADTITVKTGTWDTTPDGTSTYVVAWGWNSNSKDDFDDAGMFNKDSLGVISRRFRGLQFVPEPFRHRLVNGKRIITPVEENSSKFGNVVPKIYGSGWVNATMITNLRENVVRAHMLICEGPIDIVRELVINGHKLQRIAVWPPFNVLNHPGGVYFIPPSGRGDKSDAQMDDPVFFPEQDPYNLIAVAYIAIPPELVGGDGNGDPVGTFGAQALVSSGTKIERFDKDGASIGFSEFDNNTVWVYLDMSKIAGFNPIGDLYTKAFHSASVYASQLVRQHMTATTTVDRGRFRFNAILDSPRSASEALRGARQNARLMTYFNPSGEMGVRILNKQTNTTLINAIGSTGQQFVEVADLAGIHVDDVLTVDEGGGNEEDVSVISIRVTGNTIPQTLEVEANFANTHSASETVKGKISHTFDSSNIILTKQGPAIERFSLSVREVPNTLLGDIINEDRDFSVDGGEVSDAEMASFLRAKSTGQISADGLPNLDAFVRHVKLRFNQTLRTVNNPSANMFVRLRTSFKKFGIRIGDLVKLTYAPELWTDKVFRVIGIKPSGQGLSFTDIEYTLAMHEDSWYDTINDELLGNEAGVGFPPESTGDGGGGSQGGSTSGGIEDRHKSTPGFE